jgi:vesicle-associated membrane protein 72
VLRRELEYCQSHPEEMSRMAAVQSKVDEVKGIMVQNVQNVRRPGFSGGAGAKA